jgi:hypothetical protein
MQRFAIGNIWRSIAGKIMDTPLAVCDARSICTKDLVVADIHYRDRSGEICLVQESPRHWWSYFSEMDRDDALVFAIRLAGKRSCSLHTPFSLRSPRHIAGCAPQTKHRESLPGDYG